MDEVKTKRYAVSYFWPSGLNHKRDFLNDRRLKANGFNNKVKDWWSETDTRGKASYRVAQKMKIVKSEIKRWGTEERKEGMNIQQLLQDREEIDRREREGDMSTENLIRRETLKFELQR